MKPSHSPAYQFSTQVEALWRALGADPELEPDPHQPTVRFRVSANLGFPPHEILSSQWHPPPSVEVAFLGLHGGQSPLPGYYLDLLAWQQLQQHHQLGAFFDLFHHRWLTLLHRIWRKYRYELRARPGGADPISRSLLAITGPAPGNITSEQWLSELPLLAAPGQPATLLCHLIRHCFGYPQVSIRPWQYRRVSIPADQQNRLGVHNMALGGSLLLGGSVADCAGKFCLQLRQLTLEQFHRLLPAGRDLPKLRQLIAERLHGQLAWDLYLELAPKEAPSWHLGQSLRALLGRSCFLAQPTTNPSLTFSVEE